MDAETQTLSFAHGAVRPTTSGPAAIPPVAVAVVAVSVPPGHLSSIRPFLLSLAVSRAAGGVPVAPGALAVLLLAADPEGARPIIRSVAPDYPFPLQVEGAAGGPLGAARRAGAWAAALGLAEAPILLADARRPVAPRWAHATLSALRDGADLVSPGGGALRRLLLGWRSPIALSERALAAMEGWVAEGPPGGGPAWAGGASPWRRPGRSGLLAVTA